MFTHILLPTDGSNLSQAAIQKGVQLAKAIKAKITGISVLPEEKYYLYQTDIQRLRLRPVTELCIGCKTHQEKLEKLTCE